MSTQRHPRNNFMSPSSDLRSTSSPVSVEVKKMALAKDVLQLIDAVLTDKAKDNEAEYNRYISIAALQTKGSFWLEHDVNGRHCTSFEEWLARHDLVYGASLRNLELLVSLFPRETWRYYGKDALDQLSRMVVYAAKTHQEQRECYEAIFKAYRTKHRTFDPISFKSEITSYLERKYAPSVPPKLKIAEPSAVHEQSPALSVAASVVSQPIQAREVLPVGTHLVKRVVPVEPTNENPHPVIPYEYKVNVIMSPGLKEAKSETELWKGYALALESWVRNPVGEPPQRPIQLVSN